MSTPAPSLPLAESEKLPFTYSKLTTAKHLALIRERCWFLIRETRDGGMVPQYTPDWRKQRGFTQMGPEEDTSQDRAMFFRQIIGAALTRGVDLPTSGEPGPDELAPTMARWAEGALVHIAALYKRLDRAREAREAAQGREDGLRGRVAGLEGRLVDVERERVNETARADRAVGLLADERALYGTTVAAMTQEIARAQEQRDAETDRVKRAESERDAWKTSATSAQDALSMLRAALRIPRDVAEGDVEPVQRHELIRR